MGRKEKEEWSRCSIELQCLPLSVCLFTLPSHQCVCSFSLSLSLSLSLQCESSQSRMVRAACLMQLTAFRMSSSECCTVTTTLILGGGRKRSSFSR